MSFSEICDKYVIEAGVETVVRFGEEVSVMFFLGVFLETILKKIYEASPNQEEGDKLINRVMTEVKLRK